MAVNLSPIANHQIFTLAGVPAAGYKLFTYAAGSTTKTNTYTTSAGSVANANPIVLDSNGYPSNGSAQVQIWLTAGTSYKFVLAPSTDTDPPTSPIWTEDNIIGINDTVTNPATEWVAGSFTGVTYVSATQFTLTGDQTAILTANRRLKLTITTSPGVLYGYISSVSYAAGTTTVNVTADSGSLDSGITGTTVNYGIINATNSSLFPTVITQANTFSGNQTFSGKLTMSGKPIIEAKGANVASATTTDIWTPADGNTVHITGTTTITSLATAPQAGACRRVVFDGSLLLTNGGNLVCPGGVSIQTAANDSCLVYADTTTKMYIMGYTRATSNTAMAVVSEQQTSGTAGGTATSGAWNQRTLNTEVSDIDGLVTLSSNNIVITYPGRYLIEWSAPAFKVQGHMARLYDVTGTAVVATGSTEYSGSTGDFAQTRSTGAAVVTITASNTYRIEHFVNSTFATSGYGNAATITSTSETYTIVKIIKLA